MSVYDHLEELRQRIIISVLAVGAAIVGCFAFSKDLILLLEAPISAQGVRFLQLAPGEFFFTSLKVCLPISFYQFSFSTTTDVLENCVVRRASCSAEICSRNSAGILLVSCVGS